MPYKDIKKKAEKFRKEVNKIEERRKVWENKREEIYDLLEEMKIEIDLNWKIGRDNRVENLTSVYICFKSKPSGISKRNNGAVRHYSYQGGMLAFSQMTNGKIAVNLAFPYIEGLTSGPKRNTLEILEPADISDSKVKKYVNIFLEKMIKDLKESSQETIGFNTDEIDSYPLQKG